MFVLGIIWHLQWVLRKWESWFKSVKDLGVRKLGAPWKCVNGDKLVWNSRWAKPCDLHTKLITTDIFMVSKKKQKKSSQWGIYIIWFAFCFYYVYFHILIYYVFNCTKTCIRIPIAVMKKYCLNFCCMYICVFKCIILMSTLLLLYSICQYLIMIHVLLLVSSALYLIS